MTKRNHADIQRYIDATIKVAGNIVVDSTQVLWEVKQLGYEISEVPYLDNQLFNKLVQVATSLGHKLRKVEDDIEETREKLTKIIQHFNKEFERQTRRRDLDR